MIAECAAGPSRASEDLIMVKLTVNGVTYENVDAMPPDVRQAYDESMRRVGAGAPTVTKNELKLSFQFTGPGFSFRTGAAPPSRSQPINPATSPDPVPQPVVGTSMPSPIEPASFGGVFRIALILGACVTGGLMLWLLMRAH